MLKIGVDDAGRGPVIGPMILAGVLIDDKQEKELKQLGVKDSKELTPRRREFLAEKIKENIKSFELVVISPEEIEKGQEQGVKLNEIEAIACAKIINKLNKTEEKIRVVLDCPSTSLVKWKDYLIMKIKELSNLEILCEHKADRNHVAVSAASILAKSQREKEMNKLRKKYGEEIGSGYTSDPATQRFLQKYAEKYSKDGIFRKTWITWKKAKRDLKQKKLI
jgi:ribonuclease HII